MSRKKQIKKIAEPKDQINLAVKALHIPSERAKFLFNPSYYAKKENLRLDPKWIKMIENEVDKIKSHLYKITGKYNQTVYGAKSDF